MQPSNDDTGDVDMPEAEPGTISSGIELTKYQRIREPVTNAIMVYHPSAGRMRRTREPPLLLKHRPNTPDEYKVDSDFEPNNDDNCWPPSPKKSRVDKDSLLAEAVLAYNASLGEVEDAPTTYQQAMNSNDAL